MHLAHPELGIVTMIMLLITSMTTDLFMTMVTVVIVLISMVMSVTLSTFIANVATTKLHDALCTPKTATPVPQQHTHISAFPRPPPHT